MFTADFTTQNPGYHRAVINLVLPYTISAQRPLHPARFPWATPRALLFQAFSLYWAPPTEMEPSMSQSFFATYEPERL